MRLETRSSYIVVRPNGVVVMTTKPDWNQPDTLEVAKQNIAALHQAIGGERKGLLSHLANTHIAKDVLEYYQESNPGQVATALVTASFGAKVIGNLFLKIAVKRNYTQPVKLFTKEEEAEEWLLSILHSDA